MVGGLEGIPPGECWADTAPAAVLQKLRLVMLRVNALLKADGIDNREEKGVGGLVWAPSC